MFSAVSVVKVKSAVCVALSTKYFALISAAEIVISPAVVVEFTAWLGGEDTGEPDTVKLVNAPVPPLTVLPLIVPPLTVCP